MDWSNPLIYIVSGLAAAGALWKLGNWMGTKDQFAKTVGEAIEEIRQDIKKIFQLLPKDTLSGQSPLRLNDLGESISETLEAKAWAQRTAREVASLVKGKHPYEIQEYCMSFVKEEKYNPTADFIDKIKSCAYENALSIDKVQNVLAIELRDAILQNFPD